MELKQELEKITNSKDYQEYIKTTDAYLTHISKIQEKNSEDNWEFGFYEPKTDKITVFETNPIKRRQADETLKKEDKVVEALDLDEVNIGFEDSILIADNHAKEKKETLITKKIIILQKLDKKIVWNLTYITTSFKLLNIKISADTGEIVNSNLYSIYDMGLKNL
ncbi:MAG: hypothetical protein ACMXX7_00175 [Candidatus Woesearchaeota archaeon]